MLLGQSAIQQKNQKDRRITRESNYLDKTLRAYKTPFHKRLNASNLIVETGDVEQCSRVRYTLSGKMARLKTI